MEAVKGAQDRCGTYDFEMAEPSIEGALWAVAVLSDPTRQRLYRYIARQPAAVSREEAATMLGISRSLAAFHLEKLVKAGLLKPEYRRLSGRSGPGAGRTSKLYRRSHRQIELSLPERHHDVLARLLAESASAHPPLAPSAGAAYDFGRALGRRARKGVRVQPGSEQQLQCVQDALETVGFEPYQSGPGEIRLRNCPFDPLSRVYTPVVCGVAQAIASGVVDGIGADQLVVSREMSPDRCCGVISAVAPDAQPRTVT